MARSHGRSPRGGRLRMGVPHGHRKTTTLIAGLRTSGMVAPMVLDGPINGAWFAAYVAHVLVPELRRGDVVIMDNLASHKRAAVRELVEAAGATLVIHPEGTLVYAGAIDDQPGNFGADPAKASNNVTQSLLALKRGTPVPTPVTRPYGCSVKYQSGM